MSQDNQVKKEKVESFTDINQQRRRFSRLVTVSPVLMSLVSKSALGVTPYHCSISGAQSGNVSNPQHDTLTACNVGYSPADWRDDAPPGSNTLWSQVSAKPSTKFSDIFTISSDTRSFFNILNGDLTSSSGTLSLESHAITGYLNALLANAGDVSLSPIYDNIEPTDIVGLYLVALDPTASYTTSSGTVIDNTFGAQAYLESIHQ